MAAQRLRGGMENEWPLTLRAHLDVSAITADDYGCRAPSIDEQNRLVSGGAVELLKSVRKAVRDQPAVARGELRAQVDDLYRGNTAGYSICENVELVFA
jgi:hypothetical protein